MSLEMRFEEVCKNLSPRKKDVLRLHLGIDDGRYRTPEEIAKLFDVSTDEIELILETVFQNPDIIAFLKEMKN